jgi:hypothetical protein
VAGYASNATFNTIKANNDFDFSDTNTTGAVNVYVGGVSGYAANSIFDNITVSGSIIASTLRPTTVYPAPSNGLYVGGVVGYADGGSITDSASSVAINAKSVNTVSDAGGIVGFGAGSTTASNALFVITNSSGTASVSSTGGQTPASAAGIAGYITNATITNTHTTAGMITASAPSGSGQYDVYQAYAGGLVGYSGNSSAITLSSSTGQTIIANNAAYPYVGGLVAYQYGLLQSSPTPPSNGSTVTQSYSTNAVTAIASSNGLPYAGGLAGYSSGVGSLIENSYATGTVTGSTTGNSAWVGGLVGANAQGSVVSKSYATGNVYTTAGTAALPYGPQIGANVGAAGGGIVGTNYFSNTSTTPVTTTIVQYCAALNSLIDGSASTGTSLLHRVAGDLGVVDATYYADLGTLNDNIAYEKMSVISVWNQDIGPNRVDGADAAAQPTVTDYIDLTWDFKTIWAMGANGYPTLLGNQ